MHAVDIDPPADRVIGAVHRRVGSLALSLLPSNAYDVRARSDFGVVGFAYEGQEGWHAFAGDRPSPFRRGVNTLAWVPPGCDVLSRSRRGGEYLVVEGIVLPRTLPAGAMARPVSDAVDADAVGVAHLLRRALAGRRSLDGVWFDAAIDVLVAAVEVRLRGKAADASRWLTPGRLRTLDALIECRMADRLTVAGMAEALGLSLGFFMRAVKGSLGVTPHAYLMEKRLARARLELAAEREFDHVVVNRDVEQAARDVAALVQRE